MTLDERPFRLDIPTATADDGDRRMDGSGRTPPRSRLIPGAGWLAAGVFLLSATAALGFGTFKPKDDYPVGNAPLGIAKGDFNRDGKLDLAVVNNNDNDVSILLGKRNGTFKPKDDYPVGAGPQGIAAGDFDRD